MQTAELVEVRWHGRGGQGAVTSAELLARAAIAEGKYAQAFPSFGPERRGAPVLAFDRISIKDPIRVRAEITEPDVIVVLDSGLVSVVNVTSGLKDDGIIILNTKRSAEEVAAEYGNKWTVAVINATHIAQEILKVNIVNTTMLGALLKATGVVDIESLIQPLEDRFGRLAERNVNAMKKAYEDTVIKEQIR
ncbi:MAG: 2-oxoacid:acceptor oxidoreductase family protein [Dehalococcoidales bacterium]|nr:2-oxoacid:acceptor oxidoreductase family protein [Dehalococcoidales bacterium]